MVFTKQMLLESTKDSKPDKLYCIVPLDRGIDVKENKSLQLSKFQSLLLNWEPVGLRGLRKEFVHTQPVSPMCQDGFRGKWP